MTLSQPSDKDGKRTFLITRMCDHAHALAAALNAYGVDAEVLDAPDEISAELGGKHTLGRECLPCTLVLGDVLQRARRPGFDPAQYAVFLTTANGPCRYGQYMTLYRQVLDEQGLGDLQIMGLTNQNTYRGFGENPQAMRRLAWDGIVAVDLLQQVLYHVRPYELRAGASDAVYDAALDDLVPIVRAGGEALPRLLTEAAAAFEAVPVDRSTPRPLIAIVGEIYARMNSFANRKLIRTIERLGGEATCATFMEWMYYTNFHYGRQKRTLGLRGESLVMQLTDLYQRYRERRLRSPLARLLYWPPEQSSGFLVDAMRPYASPALECETVMTLGKAVAFAQLGAAGIVNAMPFSCMAGIVAAGLAGRIRSDYDNLPWLDLSFDLQRTTNLETRLEAFMHQAAHRQARQRAAAA